MFAAPSYAQSLGEKTRVNSVLGIAPRPKTSSGSCHERHDRKIQAAKIAQQKGNADEKKFAEMMLADHTKTSTELKSMVPDKPKSRNPCRAR